MGIAATKQLIYMLVQSPKPDIWERWGLELGIRTTDGVVADDEMSCETHEFRSLPEAVNWLREKAHQLGVSSLPEKIGPTSVPLPLGNSMPVQS